MGFYPPKIAARFDAPEHAGKIDAANGSGTNAAFLCGSAVRFSLRIEGKRVSKAGFQSNGCGYMIAAADALAESIEGKLLEELQGLEEKSLEMKIAAALGEFPESRRHCLSACLLSIRDAFRDFRAASLEEFSGEKALICTCFGVSEEAIESLVRKEGVASVEGIRQSCNAGNGCGSCIPLIRGLIGSAMD